MTDRERIAELEAALERAKDETLAHEHRVEMVKQIAKKIIVRLDLERGLERFADFFEKEECPS